jgi:hypothetical protein
MALSVRSIMALMHMKAPGVSISHDAALLLKIELERRAENITVQASRIHDRENSMRAQIGERPKVRLSPKHVKMAIEGKFIDEKADQNVH